MGSSKQGPREETYRFCACNMQVWIWRLSIHSSTALLVFIYSIQLYTPMSLCVFGFVPSDFLLRLLTHGPHKPLFLLSILSRAHPVVTFSRILPKFFNILVRYTKYSLPPYYIIYIYIKDQFYF